MAICQILIQAISQHFISLYTSCKIICCVLLFNLVDWNYLDVFYTHQAFTIIIICGATKRSIQQEINLERHYVFVVAVVFDSYWGAIWHKIAQILSILNYSKFEELLLYKYLTGNLVYCHNEMNISWLCIFFQVLLLQHLINYIISAYHCVEYVLCTVLRANYWAEVHCDSHISPHLSWYGRNLPMALLHWKHTII